MMEPDYLAEKVSRKLCVAIVVGQIIKILNNQYFAPTKGNG